MISKLSSHLGPSSIFSGGVAPSLVLHLDAGNTFSYPGSGITWYDLTSFNNDILLTDTTFNSTYNNLIKFEGSFNFNGTGSHGDLITGTAIPIMDSHYTIETWIKPNSYSLTTNGGIIGWGIPGLYYSSNALRQDGFGFLNYWWANDLSGSSTFYNTNWYHIACTYDGTTRKMYANGELISSDTPGVSHSVSTFDNLTIGTTNNYQENFDGKISSVKVWNKNLSDSQILNSFNSNKPKYGYDYGSMVFDSTNSSYVTSSSVDYAFGTNDFTIEAYVKTATQSSYDGIVSLNQNGSMNNPSINMLAGLFEFYTPSGLYNTYTASNDTWYHVAMTRNSGTVSCFVNGILQSQFYDNTNFAGQDVVIGRYYTDLDAHYIDGYISNVRIVNGTSLYSSNFIIPNTPLSATSSTQLLMISQEINSTADSIGHSVTANNVGWTSSLPYFYEFNYVNFSDITGLSLVHTFGVIGDAIKLTDTSLSYAANVYRNEAIRFDRDFNFNWVFECSGGGSPGADGFCVQWTTTNNTYGNQGGAVGLISSSSTINAFQFQTYFNNRINWLKNNIQQNYQNLSLNIRQNVYYWMDYNYATSTMYISYATTDTKPVSPQHTFNSVTFDSGNYYIGFGAATGGSVDNHILKSMYLTFAV